jgi:hypothetical protein
MLVASEDKPAITWQKCLVSKIANVLDLGSAFPLNKPRAITVLRIVRGLSSARRDKPLADRAGKISVAGIDDLEFARAKFERK